MTAHGGTHGTAYERWRWLLDSLALACGGVLVVAAATVSLNERDQIIFAVAISAIFFLLNRARQRSITVILMVLSVTVTMRYIFWRATETLHFGSPLELALGIGLLVAELYAATVMVLGYIQNIAPLGRRPLPLPPDDTTWPTVDVFIPTYHESLEVVRTSVLAAMAIDWPRDKMKVWLLDDGRRDEFKQFAAQCGCGYIVRDNNDHAKAGNLNNAMRHTTGEYIAIFDCDHIATRSFLQLTMGWMVAEPNFAMVQTPHYFYSPDAFQRNLAAGLHVPAEGNLFYGLVQDGNDYWNACFFCGSCAIMRRTALEEIEGFAVETVTEDAHTMLRLHRHGWESAYLRLPVAAGLATERLRLHIGQRVRWARGMLQIFRIDNPLLGRGLSLGQRICYLQASSHFLFPLPRVIFLTAPLAFLLAGQNVIAASPLAITAYALPHIVLSTIANSRQQTVWRHSFWSEIYETVLALFLVRVTLATLVSPRRGKFNVTAKGGLLESGLFDLQAVYPNLILAALLLGGILRGIIGITLFQHGTLVFQALLLNTIWATTSLLIVLAALAVGRETRQVRQSARVPADIPVLLQLPDGSRLEGVSADVSRGGARLILPEVTQLPDGSQVQVTFRLSDENVTVAGLTLHVRGDSLQLQWTPKTLQDEANVVRVVFGRADAWRGWGDYAPDKPLRSLWNVLVSIKGLFRPPGDALQSTRPVRAQGDSRPATGRTSVAAALVLLVLCSAAGAQSPNPGTTVRATVRGMPPPGVAAALGGSPPQTRGPASTAAGPVTAATSATPVPIAVPSPTQPVAGGESAQAGARTLVLNLRQLGAAGPMTLRGTSELQGLQFGIRADEVVTSAQLALVGALSPALIPEFSNITVTLNELYVGTIPVDREHPEFQLTMPVNPMFFLSDNNRLNFRFTGRYTAECNDPLSGLLWGSIYDNSTLTLRLERLPAQRTLGRLPLPFFDPRERERLVLPFVFPSAPNDATLKAAAFIASWFGNQAAYRGASFPVLAEPPAEGNAVIFLTGDEVVDSGLGLPTAVGPTVATVANPNDSFGSLLVVAGRTANETTAAAATLVVGSRVLGSAALATVRAPQLPRRVPYDAPNWIPSNRPVKFGELVDAPSLNSFGYIGQVHVGFRTAPDFYTWRNQPFPLDLRIHAPPGPIIDVAPSRLDTSINGAYLKSLPLARPETYFSNLYRLFGWGNSYANETVDIPRYDVFAQNDLLFYFDARPLHRGDCIAVPGDLRMSIDPDSTIDLSRGYRVSRLPNLSFFASAGFPFTRMADLSETAAVLPDEPGGVEISAFLMLMGRIGAFNGYPVTGLAVVRPENVAAVADRDLLLIGTLEHLGNAGGLLSGAPAQPVADRLSVSMAGELNPVLRLFGDDRSRERSRAAATIAAGLTEDWGALIGMENPLHRRRSLVALLATTPQAIENMVLAFDDPVQAPLVQGDLTLFTGGRPTSYRVGFTFTFGDLPFWLWPSWFLGESPALIAVLVLLGCTILGLSFFSIVRRKPRPPRTTSRGHS